MAVVHELKTDADVFLLVVKGLKTFDVRRNDRDFKVGDVLLLKETEYTGEEMKKGAPLRYTGRVKAVEVLYIMLGPVYGLKKGWCIMSVEER